MRTESAGPGNAAERAAGTSGRCLLVQVPRTDSSPSERVGKGIVAVFSPGDAGKIYQRISIAPLAFQLLPVGNGQNARSGSR